MQSVRKVRTHLSDFVLGGEQDHFFTSILGLYVVPLLGNSVEQEHYLSQCVLSTQSQSGMDPDYSLFALV